MFLVLVTGLEKMGREEGGNRSWFWFGCVGSPGGCDGDSKYSWFGREVRTRTMSPIIEVQNRGIYSTAELVREPGG